VTYTDLARVARGVRSPVLRETMEPDSFARATWTKRHPPLPLQPNPPESSKKKPFPLARPEALTDAMNAKTEELLPRIVLVYGVIAQGGKEYKTSPGLGKLGRRRKQLPPLREPTSSQSDSIGGEQHHYGQKRKPLGIF